MSLLDKLERRFRRYALPNLTMALIACQVVVFVAGLVKPEVFEQLMLVAGKVQTGQVWRLLTFLVMPPTENVLFALFFWYLFYLMGRALELNWGDFRYNVFLLIGYLATVAVSFVEPEMPATNAFLEGSVFLAFAYLFPEFTLYIFFILPVKIKWLALLTWIGYFVMILFGDWLQRLLVLASLCNFLLFFGKEVISRIRAARRRMAFEARQLAAEERPYFHRCTVCGITDRTHPRMDFRYCSQCEGAHGYCTEHLRNHAHVLEKKVGADD
jgi:hypothetical protein